MSVEFSRNGAIGCIVMSNPPMNLFEVPDFTEEDSLESFFKDTTLKAVMIRGAGKHFSAGADLEKLKTLANCPEDLKRRMNAGKRLLNIIRFAPVPVLAVIRGSCLGAGLELALSCHFRFASRGAMFGFPESGLGLIPGLGGTVLLQETVSRKDAVRLILSGDMIGAEEALKIRLIDRTENTGNLEQTACEFLTQLTAKRSVELIHTIMAAMHNRTVLSRHEALQQETELFCALAKRSTETQI